MIGNHRYAKTLEELLARCSPRVRSVLQATRQGVIKAVPYAVERFRSGWGLVGYNAPSYFAFIFADADTVRLGFEWGVALMDPLELLEGDGRQVRYITLRSSADIARPEIVALLQEAAAFKRSAAPRKRR